MMMEENVEPTDQLKEGEIHVLKREVQELRSCLDNHVMNDELQALKKR